MVKLFSFCVMSHKYKNLVNRLSSVSYCLAKIFFSIALVLALYSFPTGNALAQSVSFGDPFELYNRVISEDYLDINNFTWNFRTANSEYLQSHISHSHPWQGHSWYKKGDEISISNGFIELYSPTVLLTNNSKLDVGENDGALWQGVGYNSIVSAGIGFKNNYLSVTFRPTFIYSQNKFLEITGAPKKPGLSKYSMQLTWIDAPQRFGQEPLSRFGLGNSRIQVQKFGLKAGISNEHMWIGPSVHNPLLMSNNAPGFLHGYIGSEHPVQSQFGNFEFFWFWGGLEESNFFDEDPTNNRRYITGFTANYSHDSIKGLNIGFARVAYSKALNSSVNFDDIFLAFIPPYKEDAENEVEEQNERINDAMMSVFFRWNFPEPGFEVYGEWGVNNDRRSLRDLIAEPELNRAYTLGTLKRFTLKGNLRMLLHVEITTLENSSISSQFRERNTWYADSHVIQGYTNRGQFLGAGIGPGSSTQITGLKLYHKFGAVGIEARRIVWHNDRLFNNIDYFREVQFRNAARMRTLHEVEMRYGLNSVIFLPQNLEVQADINFTSLNNRWQRFEIDETNLNVMLTIRYGLPGWGR